MHLFYRPMPFLCSLSVYKSTFKKLDEANLAIGEAQSVALEKEQGDREPAQREDLAKQAHSRQLVKDRAQ